MLKRVDLLASQMFQCRPYNEIVSAFLSVENPARKMADLNRFQSIRLSKGSIATNKLCRSHDLLTLLMTARKYAQTCGSVGITDVPMQAL